MMLLNRHPAPHVIGKQQKTSGNLANPTSKNHVRSPPSLFAPITEVWARPVTSPIIGHSAKKRSACPPNFRNKVFFYSNAPETAKHEGSVRFSSASALTLAGAIPSRRLVSLAFENRDVFVPAVPGQFCQSEDALQLPAAFIRFSGDIVFFQTSSQAASSLAAGTMPSGKSFDAVGR